MNFSLVETGVSGRPVSRSGLPTYQPEEEEADDADAAEEGRTDDVAEADGAHGDHEEVDALPVAHVVNLGKVGEVASVLQLISCRVVGGKARNEESELGVHRMRLSSGVQPV